MSYFVRSNSRKGPKRRAVREGDKPELEAVLDHYGIEWHPGPGNHQISCPLHDDRVPSCSVNFDKQLWRCYSCGERGDSWTLLMRKEDIGFVEAKDLARRLGLVMAAGSGNRDRVDNAKRTSGRLPAVPYVPSWRRRGSQ